MGESGDLPLQLGQAVCSRLLAECYHLPVPDLAEKIENLAEVLREVCREAVSYAVRMKEGFDRIRDFDDLRRDYARLFVGPYRTFAPPYGSVYLEDNRQIMGLSTLDVMERYRRNGLTLAEDFHDVADHVAVELEFLWFLGCRQVSAVESHDLEAATQACKERENFLREHLGAWISEFASQVEENSGTEFYRNLARCSRTFLECWQNGGVRGCAGAGSGAGV